MDLYLANDNLLVVRALKNRATGAYINNATVTGELLTLAGTQVSGQTWPMTFAYVPDSDGEYHGVFEDSLALTLGESYRVKITVDAGSDRIAQFTMNVKARERIISSVGQ